MSSNYSIWLLPHPKCEVLIKSLIKKTTNYFSATEFDAHCTLAGGVNKSLSRAIELLNSFKSKSKLIRCESISLKVGNPPWKTFYIDIKMNPKIFQIQNYISEEILAQANYFFDPHISLIYGRFNERDLRRFIKNSDIPVEIIFDRLAIVDTSGAVKDWDIVYEQKVG